MGALCGSLRTDESNSQQRILTYYLSSGGRRNHEEFYFVADDRDVQGIWSDGTVMWIADGEDRKIYAYSLESQSLNNHDRLFSKDISLDSSNDDPKGNLGLRHHTFRCGPGRLLRLCVQHY